MHYTFVLKIYGKVYSLRDIYTDLICYIYYVSIIVIFNIL